ncbi:MAG: TIGR04283 family arsenosugar biosynthesis glycosyltransferase [Synechococcus sp.]
MIIPCLNEAQRLPLLLADLQRWHGPIECIVVDGGSHDRSADVVRLSGAQWMQAPQRGRGCQLAHGAQQAQGTWLLFLHSDSRLGTDWADALVPLIHDPSTHHAAWYFDLKLTPSRPSLRILEAAVAMRSRWLQRPYGDQGLLLHRDLYTRCGGYAHLPLMEDLDLVQKLAPLARLRPIGQALLSDGRRWHGMGVLERSWRNARLRQRWRQGVSAQQLAADYYGQSREGRFNWHTKNHNAGHWAQAPNPDADKRAAHQDQRTG